MVSLDLNEFLRLGKLQIDINLNDDVWKLNNLLGCPKEKVGNKEAGFLYYTSGLRIGYMDNKIDEIGLIFNEYKDVVFSGSNIHKENLTITWETQIHDFIYYLNTNKIPWKCVDEKNSTAFIIKINNLPLTYFDLYTGRLLKIFVSRR